MIVFLTVSKHVIQKKNKGNSFVISEVVMAGKVKLVIYR